MSLFHWKKAWWVAACVALSLPAARLGAEASAVGFAPERLERIGAFFGREIAAGRYAGAVWKVMRDGAVVAQGEAGYLDALARTPMTGDTVFAIASMTKLVTTVTVLSLLEDGRFNLDDPVALYLPALAGPQVLTGGTAEAPQLAPATQPVTIRQLLMHTSGYCYGFFDGEPLRTLYGEAGLWECSSLAEFVEKAGKLPLAHQPGTAWHYGISTDLLGALVEKVTGRSLEAVMRERIFEPLGLHDTGFSPPADSARLARMHKRGTDGRLELTGSPLPAPKGTFVSGGGGLYSTRDDYARFAQMLLNGGELDGRRVLGRKTVELMSSNQVDYLNPRPRSPFLPPGFGLGVSVRRDAADEAESLGSPGQYGWAGITTTYVSIDPCERMVLILMLQHAPFNEGGLFEKFSNVVYQALK